MDNERQHKQQEYLDNALTEAVLDNDTEHMKLLVEAGADVNAADCYGFTPLHTAVFWRRGACVKLFIRYGADINAVNKYGDTPLHFAANNADIKCMRLLIAAGADLDAKNNLRDMETPADIFRKKFTDIYAEHIDELRKLVSSTKKLKLEDTRKKVDTGFEFDL